MAQTLPELHQTAVAWEGPQTPVPERLQAAIATCKGRGSDQEHGLDGVC